MEQPCYTWDTCDKIIEELLHALKYRYKGFLLRIYLKNHELKVDGNADQCISSVAMAPVQSQLKPEAEPSLAEAQPELPSDGSYILPNSGSG